MKRKKIAVQLYTVRDFCETPSDLAKTLKKLKEAGFEAVQVSGVGPIETKELKNLIEGEGLVCCATHEGAKMIVEETEKVIEKLQILDCKYTAYAYPHVPLKNYEDCANLAKALSKAGKMMAKEGLVLCYHNHAIEFERFEGKTALDIIYDESDPEYLQGEIDTYWVQFGGQDPAEWCKKLSGRLPLLHLKEYGIVDNKVVQPEIGSGNLDWKKIVKAAKKSGTEWFIIEHDKCLLDPFESLRIGLEYLVEEV